jgi:hypothetical protein
VNAPSARRVSAGETLIQQRRGLAHPLLHTSRGAADALADALYRHRRQRIQRRGDHAEQPVQIQHRGDQSDHSHRIGDAIDRAGQRITDDGGVGGETRRKLGRRLALQPGQVGFRQMCKHAALQFANHQQHHLLNLYILEVLCSRLDRRDCQHERGYLIQDPLITIGEHLKRVVYDDRIERGGAGHQGGQYQHQQQTGLMVADMLPPQPHEQLTRAVAAHREVGAGCGGIHQRRLAAERHGVMVVPR